MAAPVTLLHPFPLDSEAWDPVTAELRRGGHPVLVPDHAGFGRTGGDGPSDLDAAADRVAERIREEMPGERSVIAGISMGGYTALALAARHPERVAALVLADTRAEADDEETRRGREESARRVRAEGTGPFLDGLFARILAPGAEDARARLRPIADRQPAEAVARALLAMGARPDRRADLPAMTAPALVVVGERDVVTPPDAAAALAEGLPDAELLTVPGAGHLAPLERPEPFVSAVTDFIARRVDP